MTPLLSAEPPQPPESGWKFVEDLKAPLWSAISFQRARPRRGEVSLRGGITVRRLFPDPESRLATAYLDLDRFLAAAGIGREGGYPITVRQGKAGGREGYRLVVEKEGCTIVAEDTEGARRAIFFLEDEILRTAGLHLTLGTTRRKPVIRTRVSRCFFGPINRPPKNRDELADDIDYYPDEYLNRLAHDGVNGLWITASFKDLCPSRFFPEFGKEAERRLRKLRRTVETCARYGIKIYIFCIEPRGFGNVPQYLHSPELLKRHPELAGHRTDGATFFCTSSGIAQEYLEEATFFLFSQAPGLGGLIDINLGERPTHCYSYMLWDHGPVNCPRCSRREPWEVFRDTLEPMRRGMCKANPDAELISWLYVPHVLERPDRPLCQFQEQIRKVAAHFPKEVIFQYNYESMGKTVQLGRERTVRDYSLAYAGPSLLFRDFARAAGSGGIRTSAKLQVGCSHEVATVPCVPAPGNLYRKYREMHRLGVSAAMQCWYFGNYPSVMTRAAGELSFAPLPASEAGFLRRLAAPAWGRDAARVARAWRYFGEAYRQFPANLTFAWYGPVHDSVVWPLHLKPVDRPIAPSWLLGFPPSGDRIGECLGFEHTLPEALRLCERMSRTWARGTGLLREIEDKYSDRPGHLLEIGLALALGIQFESAWNVLKFYAVREKLYFECDAPLPARRRLLASLRRLMHREIENSKELEKLARRDSRLGFHSEAEGYKYFPAKLKWRIRLLKKCLESDFPAVERSLTEGRPLFPAYRGVDKNNGQNRYRCRSVEAPEPDAIAWGEIEPAPCRVLHGEADAAWQTSWKAVHDSRRLYIKVTCATPPKALRAHRADDYFVAEHLRVSIEPRRLWPTHDFYIGPFGQNLYDSKQVSFDPTWKAAVTRCREGWRALLIVPFACLKGASASRLRINVERVLPETGNRAWIPCHPARNRLIFGTSNPADFGWLELEPK